MGATGIRMGGTVWVVALLIVASALAAVASPSDASSGPDLSVIARQYQARQWQVDIDDVEVIRRTRSRNPLNRSRLFHFKLENGLTGESVDVTLNRRGRLRNAERLLARAMADQDRANGKIGRHLAAALESRPPKALSGVVLWLAEPFEPVGASMEEAAAGLQALAEDEYASETMIQATAELLAEAAARRAETAARATAPIVERLADNELEPYATTYVPAVFVTATSQQIAEIVTWPEVIGAYLAEGEVAPDVYDSARDAVGATTAHKKGVTGSGIAVGQVEAMGFVEYWNRYLNGSVVADSRVMVDRCLGDVGPSHPTTVAGMTHFIAGGARILASGWCGNDALYPSVDQSLAWIVLNGARSINNSWSEGPDDDILDWYERLFDKYALDLGLLFIATAGNDGTKEIQICSGRFARKRPDGTAARCGPFAGSPSSGYNVLSIGAFNDHNTAGRGDDTISAFSNWADPWSFKGDREKPDIAAPGEDMVGLCISGWKPCNSAGYGKVGSGTSWAAPIVNGGVALIYQRRPNLQSWPEVIRAILMVTAINNIEGASRLSEKDGAGGIRLDWADYLAQVQWGSNGGWNGWSYSCGAVTNFDVPDKINLTAGKRARVVLTWNSNPGYESYDWWPSADLDLRVFSPSGERVAISSSYDNTYEIAQFTPQVSGNYTIRVTKHRCNASPGRIGVAWQQNT